MFFQVAYLPATTKKDEILKHGHLEEEIAALPLVSSFLFCTSKVFHFEPRKKKVTRGIPKVARKACQNHALELHSLFFWLKEFFHNPKMMVLEHVSPDSIVVIFMFNFPSLPNTL